VSDKAKEIVAMFDEGMITEHEAVGQLVDLAADEDPDDIAASVPAEFTFGCGLRAEETRPIRIMAWGHKVTQAEYDTYYAGRARWAEWFNREGSDGTER